MPDRPVDLPEFARPPIDEVVIGLQFLPLEAFSDEQVSSYWQTVRSDYPIVQYQPRLESTVQPLGQVQFAMGSGIPIMPAPPGRLGRTWLISADDSFLIQIQNDRFVHNWRHRRDEYPRFEAIHDLFWKRYREFRGLLREQGFPKPQLQQVEVTYINWIPDEQLRSHQFFRPAESTRVDIASLAEYPEPQFWIGTYDAQDNSRPVGRLTVQAQSGAVRLAPKPERGSLLTLNFLAPVPPALNDGDIDSLLTNGRELIVRAFTQLTSDNAHHQWSLR